MRRGEWWQRGGGSGAAEGGGAVREGGNRVLDQLDARAWLTWRASRPHAEICFLLFLISRRKFLDKYFC